jgi:hypothetical protein
MHELVAVDTDARELAGERIMPIADQIGNAGRRERGDTGDEVCAKSLLCAARPASAWSIDSPFRNARCWKAR